MDEIQKKTCVIVVFNNHSNIAANNNCITLQYPNLQPHAKVLTVDLLQLKNNTVISFAVYVHGQAAKLNQSPTVDL